MYKLLIVDDETIIREGIIANVDFAGIGLELVGSCENGLEALDVVKEHQPDIVMTDINMPFMNGMQLAEEILILYPLTKIVFLTGFDRFEYVKEALKLKIMDYLVKPVLPRELTEIFTKAIQVIDSERAADARINLMEEKLAETVPVLRERFFNRMIKGPMITRELQGNLEAFGVSMELGIGFYQAMCIVLPEEVMQKKDYNQLDASLSKVMTTVYTFLRDIRDCLAFRTYSDCIAVVVGSEEKCDVVELSELLSEKVDEVTSQHLGIEVGIGLGKVVSQLERISESYQTAEEALDLKFFNSDSHIISYYDLNRKRGGRLLSMSPYAAKIHQSLKNGTLATLHKHIDEAFLVLGSYALPINNYYFHVQNLLTSILLSLDEQGIEYQDVFTNNVSPSLHLHGLKTLDSMRLWLKDFCGDIIAYVLEEREDYQINQAKGAIDYMRAHYMDQEISLKKVCKELCMSVSYFSLIFKEATGTTFVDYLTKLRMEKAKELLRNTHDKTYTIADAVGYKDAHYFSLVFKKYTGMTATAFRVSLKVD